MAKLEDASPRYLQSLVDRLNQAYPENSVVNIVCHGHSVPAGYFHTPEVRSLDSYPHLLFAALKQRFPNAVLNVIVTAVGGESSDSGAKRFTHHVLSHRPALVTIDYALNDRRIGLPAAHAAWTRMIRHALASDVKVLLLTPTPAEAADQERAAQDLAHHRAQIIALSEEFRVGLVDSWDAFHRRIAPNDSVESLLSYRNHPNRRGHELVRDELLKWF